VWEKILDELESNDLFPLALSCRYFRQKQKKLVARQSGPESGKPRRRLALKTTFTRWNFHRKSQPETTAYLQFCFTEKASRDDGQKKSQYIRRLAAFHGYLPLLQQFVDSSEVLGKFYFHSVASYAGESSSSSSTSLFPLLTRFLFFAARGGQLETLQ